MATVPIPFCALPLAQQLLLVWREGTLVAARLAGQQIRTLYQMQDFFCELRYDSSGKQVVALNCYPTSHGLDDYLNWIQLPALPGLLP